MKKILSTIALLLLAVVALAACSNIFGDIGNNGIGRNDS